jgi:hypothetical protein
MKEVQEKLLPGELGVSPRVLLLILPQEWGTKGVDGTESRIHPEERRRWQTESA